MTDGSGVVRWAADYKPFGEATVDQTVSTITNNLRFPGQYYDAETGLLYNYFRVLNTSTGRYNEADPVGIKRGENHLYTYVGNNPLLWIDPRGLSPIYSCKRPLGGKPGEDTPPLLNHQYNCVTQSDGTKKCDSTSPGWGWPLLATPGKPSDPNKDYYQPNACKKVSDDKDNCIKDCLTKAWSKPRPRWDIGPDLGIAGGTDCQEYSDDTLKECTKGCSK